MIRAAISFFILALVCFMLGAYGIAGLSMEIGKILLAVFLVLTFFAIVGAFVSGGKPKIFR